MMNMYVLNVTLKKRLKRIRLNKINEVPEMEKNIMKKWLKNKKKKEAKEIKPYIEPEEFYTIQDVELLKTL